MDAEEASHTTTPARSGATADAAIDLTYSDDSDTASAAQRNDKHARARPSPAPARAVNGDNKETVDPPARARSNGKRRREAEEQKDASPTPHKKSRSQKRATPSFTAASSAAAQDDLALFIASLGNASTLRSVTHESITFNYSQ